LDQQITPQGETHVNQIKSLIPWLVTTATVIAAAALYFQPSSIPARQASPADSALVTTLEVTETVDASGYIQANSYASLAWKTAGTVEKVYVQAGEHVKAGDTLLSLQANSAAASVIAAEADLRSAQLQLNALQNPDGEARALAQVNLASAYAAWNTLRKDLSDALSAHSTGGDSRKYDTLTEAQADLDSTLDAYALSADPASQWYYWTARSQALQVAGDYDFAALTVRLRSRLDPDDADLIDDIISAQSAYETAAIDFVSSLEDYETAVAINNSLATYQQSSEKLLSASQDAYEKLVAANPQDLAAARARVSAAQATLDTLKIVAPFDGEVLAVEQHPGDIVAAGSPALILADRTSLYIDLQVDEADIARVVPGSLAAISIDTLSGQTLTGAVTWINPVGANTSGLVKYAVRIELAPAKEPLLLGATADVTIQVGGAQNALAVPASALQNDSTGEYVEVLDADGRARRVAVESGVEAGSLVVVRGDLNPGERVKARYQNGVQAPNPLAEN